MRQTWRWFGPADAIAIEEIEQAGAQGIVTALHHIPNGTIWSPQEIATRQAQIATRADGTPSTLRWDVVESLPVSEDIKKQDGDWRAHIEAYKTSLENIAAAGISVVCYNFMPVLDWTRTDTAWRLPVLSPRRSALSAAGPAACGVDRGGLCRHDRGGGQPGEWRDAVQWLAGGGARQ